MAVSGARHRGTSRQARPSGDWDMHAFEREGLAEGMRDAHADPPGRH
jgi:hypothetical protein